MKFLKKINSDSKVIIRDLRQLNESLINAVDEYQHIILEQNGTIANQKVEIDELRMMNDAMNDSIRPLPFETDFDKAIKSAKAEAIKEFAERVKENFNDMEYSAKTNRKTIKVEELRGQMDWVLHTVIIETIDNLVKEMVGDSDA